MLEFTEHRHLPASARRNASPRVTALATEILADIMRFRRFTKTTHPCVSTPCKNCLEPHLSKMALAVAQGLPITFVLPAFPGKSPNRAKVLGILPDMAERKALEFLQHLCDRVQAYYPPGARIILCADGRVFSDVVGMRDDDVTAYQRELCRILTDSGLTAISAVNLDDLYKDLSFDQMRARLMEQYGESLEVLKSAVNRGGKSKDCSVEDQEAHRLYCGITRFLVEDAMFLGQALSRSAIQKECRIRAYAVIQRSRAWGSWVEERFPRAIRLSIHPQSCGAKKLGIRLIEQDHWMTPWHAVAVEMGGRFVLFKRAQAEELGARLIHIKGRPSHYVLDDESGLSKLQGVIDGP